MEKIEITTNYDRAVKVAKAAIGMLETKVYPFDQPEVFPDAIIPKGILPGSLDHALYLFYSVPLDSGRESKSVYKRARELFKHLHFKEFPELDVSCIEYYFHQYFESPSKNNQSGKLWADPINTLKTNAEMIHKEYDNDPRKIKKSSVSETLKAITKFKGYGKTNNSLFLKNMVRAGIWNFPHNGFPIKIDRHAIKISLGTKVISVKGTKKLRFEKLVKPLDEIYKKVIQQENISAIDLNDAFWAIGQYRCKENDAINCEIDCSIKCTTRPKTDRKFTTITPDQETRKDIKNLFNWKN